MSQYTSQYSFETHYCRDSKSFYIRYATQKDIDTLEIPEDIEDLSVTGDYIQSFRIPHGVKNASFTKCALRELYVADTVELLYIDGNHLVELELPENIVLARASDNLIQRVRFRSSDGTCTNQPKKLQELYLKNNRLVELDFIPPACMDVIDIRNNYKLLHLGHAVQRLWNHVDENTIDN
jgi:hypothetical protein